MIETHGLTHINLEVSDPQVSLEFYKALFGVEEYFRDDHSIQVLGPGPHDVLAFVKSDRAGMTGGISHFGFRLKRAEDIESAIASAREVGARIVRTGEFSAGLPFMYLLDPDGYEIEVWFE